MPASPGGSVVDQSLVRQAADHGVTICFADLDGADGLWVPEERTVLVNRGLSDAKVAEVIEHELAHVMIDDQHADLDAGKDVLVGRAPSRYRRPQTVALAAVSLVVVVGGAMYGVSMARDSKDDQVIAPNPTGAGLGPPSESGEAPQPSSTVTTTTLPNGEVRTIVITSRPPAATPSGVPTSSPVVTPTATMARPPQPSRSAASSPAGPQVTTSAPPVQPTSDPTVSTSPPGETTPAPTTPPAETGGQGGVGDGTNTDPAGDGVDPGPTGSEPANGTLANDTVGDVSVPPAPGDTTTP